MLLLPGTGYDKTIKNSRSNGFGADLGRRNDDDQPVLENDMDKQKTGGPKLGCITLLSGLDAWPDNVYTEQMRLWLLEESDEEITWPTEQICNIAASLTETLPLDFHMVCDGDGGIVFHPPNKNGGHYHVWDDGEIHRIEMRNDKVIQRDRLIAR